MTLLSGSLEHLVGALAALVEPRGGTDHVDQLAHDGCAALGGRTAAILVQDGRGGLVLLAATSHEVEEIELLQAQSRTGPCVEVMESRQPVSATGASDFRARWGEVGAAMVDAGYAAVDAFPLRWKGHVLGGLNVFRTADEPLGEAERAMGQAFADVATLVLLQPRDVTLESIRGQVEDAVGARSVIEQAKGVLAHVHRTDVTDAFARLRRRAELDDVPLQVAAAEVVSEQSRRD